MRSEDRAWLVTHSGGEARCHVRVWSSACLPGVSEKQNSLFSFLFCVYVCLCLFVHLCVCLSVYICVYICICLPWSLCLSSSVSFPACVFISQSLSVFVCAHAHLCVCVCVRVCLSLCLLLPPAPGILK